MEPRPRDISWLVKGKPTPSNVLIKATQIAATLPRAYLLTLLPGNSIFAWPKRARDNGVVTVFIGAFCDGPGRCASPGRDDKRSEIRWRTKRLTCPRFGEDIVASWASLRLGYLKFHETAISEGVTKVRLVQRDCDFCSRGRLFVSISDTNLRLSTSGISFQHYSYLPSKKTPCHR